MNKTNSKETKPAKKVEVKPQTKVEKLNRYFESRKKPKKS